MQLLDVALARIATLTRAVDVSAYAQSVRVYQWLYPDCY